MSRWSVLLRVVSPVWGTPASLGAESSNTPRRQTTQTCRELPGSRACMRLFRPRALQPLYVSGTCLPDLPFMPVCGGVGPNSVHKEKRDPGAAWDRWTTLVLSLLLRHIKLIACFCLLAPLLFANTDEVAFSSMSLSAISSALLCSLSLSANCR